MQVGAGLLIALAVGAAAGGWWLLAGVVLAGLLAWLTPCAEVPHRAEPLVAGTRMVVRLAGMPLFASVFAAYLVPGQPRIAAVVLVLLVTIADALGFSLPRYARGWLLGILLVGAAGLVALCLAISPERGAGEHQAFTGMFAAGAALFPLLNKRNLGSLAAVPAVCAAALYQLGPVRLGLSKVPVRDLLAAVDGQPLYPLLAGIVVVATVPAALRALAGARADLPRRPGAVACGLAAAVGAALLEPEQALLLVAALALAEVLIVNLLTISAQGRDVRAVLAAALAITLLAWVPPRYLLLAVLVLALGVTARTRAPSAPRPPRTG
ncbi:hypothetical protein [Amycolatopsis sp.]|uniref:hypothetical protein n=1 Tax=Amycolatopsis sp. TaxID=37632 RepID=UPI002C3998A9|nr:hypothetical protein [Amycolatopsis sp.]HVV08794.1 hypothetical protein [Amycolatopsis sp.]